MRFAKNPLPGMNPWLETYWGDIHTKLTTYACDSIQSQLPADLQARVEEYLSVSEAVEDRILRRHVAPDAHIIEQPDREFAAASPDSGVMLAEEPLHIRRIPLRQQDDDALLPLQEILNQAYINGRYGNDIDYSRMPEPNLEADDWTWICKYLQHAN